MDRVVCCVRSLVLIVVALQLVLMTVAAPADHLIPSLPGQPKVDFKQYGGYITVDQSHGRKLFYYFVEATNSSAQTPLVLWLNGGPGCSSLEGAFAELGPFHPSPTGDGLIVNSAAWNQVANIIFLESPAGVGFSYSLDNTTDYNTTDEKTAQDALTFLVGWLGEYSEYNSTDFYITGESYAGHYVPQLAAAILKNNKVSGQPQIRLKGIMVGNPLFDEIVDGVYSPLEYAWGHGMLSQNTHDVIVKECNWTAPLSSAACFRFLSATLNETYGIWGGINPYDVLEDVCTQGAQAFRLKALHTGMKFKVDPCVDNEVTAYLNRKDVENALHTEVTGWSECSSIVNYNFNRRLRYWPASLTQISQFGFTDIVVPLIGTRQIINTLAKDLTLNTTSSYQPWYQGNQVGGWTVSWGKLAYSTVRGAGHMVPASQPARSLQLFISFLAGNNTPPLIPYPLI